MKKKLVALLMCLVLALSSVSGCGPLKEEDFDILNLPY